MDDQLREYARELSGHYRQYGKAQAFLDSLDRASAEANGEKWTTGMRIYWSRLTFQHAQEIERICGLIAVRVAQLCK